MNESTTLTEPTSELMVTDSDVFFECPRCDKSMVIDEVAIGAVVRCPRCDLEVIVPEPSTRTADREVLFAAAAEGDPDLIRLVLGRLGDADLRDPNGWTPLMVAARQGREDAVKTLLDCHADIEAVDPDGHTALSLAMHADQLPVVSLLLKSGATTSGTFGRIFADKLPVWFQGRGIAERNSFSHGNS